MRRLLAVAGYVHCDLKPNNILVSAEGNVKVIDLGQACPIGEVKERIQGTPDFIAPEQVKRGPVSVQTDVFNLGATFYFLLSGKKLPTLFTVRKSENSFIMSDAIPSPAQINPRVPENLSNLVMECVQTNPARRPGDMAQLGKRLEVVHFSMSNAVVNTPGDLDDTLHPVQHSHDSHVPVNPI
jgi:serine/threonine-protein kinase